MICKCSHCHIEIALIAKITYYFRTKAYGFDGLGMRDKLK